MTHSLAMTSTSPVGAGAATSTSSSFDPSWRLVSRYVERAEREYAVERKQIYISLGISSPALSAWTTDNNQPKISLPQIFAFAKLTHMSAVERMELVFARLTEKANEKLALDLPLLLSAFGALMPTAEEQQVLAAYQEAFAIVPFRVFTDPARREQLREAMHKIAQEALTEEAAECRTGT